MNEYSKSQYINLILLFFWLILWVVFLFASIVTYGFDFDALKINDGMSLWTYILNLLAPHRWLGLATVIIFVRGCIFVWLEWIEQSWPVLKKFRAFIISVILFLILILISIYF